MNRAVGYARVSTQEQASMGVSLEAQVERLEAYCKMQGLELVAVVVEDGVSAARPLAERPGGAKLLEHLADDVTHVVGMKLDRLFRSAVDALQQTEEWDRAGVALHLVDMGGQAINTASATGRMFLTMMAGFAEFERRLIAERTAAALQHNKARRQVYNHTPYGFDRVGDYLRPNEQEQRTVRRVQAWRVEGWSLRRIANELNRQGIPTKHGKTWYASTVRNLLENDLHKQSAAKGVA